MSTYLVAAMGLVYAYVAFDQFRKGDFGTSAMFAGYSFSNFGLCFVVK